MGGVGAAVWKVMGVLLVAMLPGVVEAAGLVRDACQTFDNIYFGVGCGFGCGASTSSGTCPATERTPEECDTTCVQNSASVRPPSHTPPALRQRSPRPPVALLLLLACTAAALRSSTR